MSDDSTISDQFTKASRASEGSEREVLIVVYRAGEPLPTPTRHVLDGVARVVLGRGDASTWRGERDGKTTLELRLPDPAMSSDHGALVRGFRGWQLDDPRSKNGAYVDGRAARTAHVARGAVLQLGHTVLLLDRLSLPSDALLDGPIVTPPDPLAAFATFEPRFGAQLVELPRVATAEVPILVTGETGTGKEVLARAIHTMSGRRGELVAVNCGAIPSTLVESELFGHRKGAFSGALADRLGHVRTADKGTLFLDEIGELSPAAQTALLRVLQQREVVPVGDSLPIRVDVRLVAATHRHLPTLVEEGKFRDDLYARLLGVTVTLPALRARRADLGVLVHALLARIDANARVTPAAITAVLRHTWPRNVRELERALVGGHARSGGAPIDVDHLPDELRSMPAPIEPAAAPTLSGEDEALRSNLVQVLTRHGGNVASAARELGKHREQIHRWAKRLGIDLESFRT